MHNSPNTRHPVLPSQRHVDLGQSHTQTRDNHNARGHQPGRFLMLERKLAATPPAPATHTRRQEHPTGREYELDGSVCVRDEE